MKIRKKVLVISGSLLFVLLALLMVYYQEDIPVEILIQKYAKDSSEFVEVQLMNVHYRDEGPPTDTIPLILLHGTSSSLLTWEECVKDLRNQHRIISMDLPGFGLTGPHPNNDYSIAAYVSFLNEFLNKMGVTRCYLVGNSLGGQIAAAYAAVYPNQIDKLVLIDPAGYPMRGSKGSLAFTLAQIPVVNRLLTKMTPRLLVKKSLEDVYADKSKVTDALVEVYFDMACREGNRKALVERLKSNQVMDTTFISKLSMPTMVIWGALDYLIPVANAYKFQRDLLNDTLVILPGVGHIPMEESPVKVAQVISAYLN